jgi:hypothetical protein
MSAPGLRTQILLAVRRDGGLRLAELCEITRAPLAAVRAAAWALCTARQLDYCSVREDGKGGGYFVTPPDVAPIRRTA